VKVRVSYAVEVGDEYRRAINRYYGKPGLATRDDVKKWFWAHGQSMDDDLTMDGDDDEG
jgi:hypothetical protein